MKKERLNLRKTKEKEQITETNSEEHDTIRLHNFHRWKQKKD